MQKTTTIVAAKRLRSLIFVKKTQSTTRPDPARPSPAHPSPGRPSATCTRNFRFNGVGTPKGSALAPKTESGRGSRGRGGAVNRADGNGGGVFLRAFAAFRTTSPEQFPVSSFFPQKSFAWHPPEIKGEFVAPTKAP